jgi:hypothetical protein
MTVMQLLHCIAAQLARNNAGLKPYRCLLLLLILFFLK